MNIKIRNVYEEKNPYMESQIEYLEKENKKLNNIIKEAREYIKSIEHEPDADMYIELGQYEEYKHILEILDKGSD